MRIFGVRFRVVPSRIKERRTRGTRSYRQLVILNALRKAEDVAGKVRNGIVIGADTVMVQDKKIFGKPRNINHARQMLKSISRKPQDVYTGLAVIDAATGEKLTACEKTCVYMDRLTDNDITDYFNKVTPLDKAGSYDIQGKGGVFVRRIDGCFYNVVGLPLRTLYRMLKALGALCVVVAFCAGCVTEYNIATGKEDTFYYSTDKEVQMGKAITKQVEKEYKLAEDPLLQDRVEKVGKKIAAVSDRKEIDYYFYVLEDDEVNAFALPGGFIYVNKGLLEKTENDDELAGVLAHEIGHIVGRHSIKKLQGYQGYTLLRVLLAVTPQTASTGSAADLAFTEILLGYGREDELLADQLGARYSKLAGYDPRGMIDFLEKLQEMNKRKPPRPKSYFKTHPYVPDRIRVVKQELGESLNFTDYINIEQLPHR